MKLLPVLALLASLLACGPSSSEPADKDAPDPTKTPVVVMETSHGTIKIELNAKKAPITVKNFLDYVDAKHYDNTVFHRVIPTFMIQGGGFKKGMENARNVQQFQDLEKKTRDPIKNEASNGLSNERGTIAMARTSEPDTATAQFFINVKDNKFLNPNDDSAGYAVFGKVIEGMDVVDKIKNVETRTLGGGIKNVPVKDVVIKSVRRANKEK